MPHFRGWYQNAPRWYKAELIKLAAICDVALRIENETGWLTKTGSYVVSSEDASKVGWFKKTILAYNDKVMGTE